MATHDYNIANQTGADFRADLNNALLAIVSNNSNATSPSTTYAYQLWVDTANNVLKLRNSANSDWITTGISITASNSFTGDITGNSATATALATARTINGVSFDGTANISFNTDSVSEGSSNLYFTNERVDDQVNSLLTAGSGISLTYDDAAGTLTIANTNSADITSVVAGDGLTGGGTSGDVTLAVSVDDSSIEINSDTLRVKASGITNAMLAGSIANDKLAGSIANSKLANSSVTINSQAISLGGSHTFDSDDISEGSSNLYFTNARARGSLSLGSEGSASGNGAIAYNSSTGVFTYTPPVISGLSGDTDDLSEGSSNLYYTDARSNAAIDARVTNTFINNLSGVVADTATALATARSIALSGDVTASGVNFDGTGDITLSTTIAANSVALGTDTTGNYVAGISGTTNEIEVSGSGSETASVTIGLPDNVTIAGDLTVNGTTTTVNTATLEVEDPLIKLAKANSGADSVDIGFYGLYDTSGSQDLYAGLFRDASDSGKFKLFKDLQAEPTTTVNTSGTGYAVGTLVSNLEGNVTGNVTGNVSGSSGSTTGNAATATALATGRTIGMTGDVVWTSASFDGSGNVTGTATIQANSVALGTDTTGDYVSTITAGTGLTSTGATSGEGVAHSLSVDAAQTQITSVGTLSSLTVSGDATFDTSTLKVDSTNNRVGIGDTSPDRKLHVNSGNTNECALFESTDTEVTLELKDTTGTAKIKSRHDFRFETGDTEAMRIDSSGNLFVGKTSSGLNTAGVEFASSGRSRFTRDGNNVAEFNRKTDDGSIVTFNKDATAIGTIGVLNSNNLTITCNTADHGGLQFGTHSITPMEAGSDANGTIDLGSANSKFQRLYVSDGITDTGQAGSVTVFNEGGTTADFRVESTSNANMLFVDGGLNKVGIGTGSPDKLLHLKTSVNNTAVLRIESTASDSYPHLEFKNDARTFGIYGAHGGLSDAFSIYDGTAGVHRFTINTSGNVGIGTTSPGQTLDVRGSVQFGDGGSGVALNFNATGNAQLKLNNTEKVRIDTTGVGIGTTSPANLLHVVGSGSTPFATQRDVNSGGFAMIQGKMGDSASTSAGHVYSALVAGIEDNTNGAEDGYFALEVSEGGSGSEKLRVTSAGNLGLGTISPVCKFNIVDASSPTVRIKDTTNDCELQFYAQNSDAHIGTRSNHPLIIDTNNTEAMRIDASGNLGIGTTSPSANLHVSTSSGDCTVLIEAAENASGSEPRLQLKGTNTSSNPIIEFGDSAAFPGSIEYENSDNSMRLTTNTSEAVRIDSSGNVGIGTSSPDDKLHIEGTDTSTSDTFGLRITNFSFTTNTTAGILFENADNHNAYIRSLRSGSSSGILTFGTNTGAGIAESNISERMRIDSSGNLLVGVTSALDPSSSTTAGHTLYGGSTGAAIHSRNGGNPLALQRTGSNGAALNFFKTNSIVGSVSITTSATTYNTSSDERLKDVTGSSRGLDVINSLNPVSFNWKADNNADEGLIAQEVEKVMPNAVSQTKDGYYMMDYSKLVTPLVKAIQEQQEQIESLKSDIANLKGE